MLAGTKVTIEMDVVKSDILLPIYFTAYLYLRRNTVSRMMTGPPTQP